MFTIKATNYRGLPNIHWEIPPGFKAATEKIVTSEATLNDLRWKIRFVSGDAGIARYPYHQSKPNYKH